MVDSYTTNAIIQEMVSRKEMAILAEDKEINICEKCVLELKCPMDKSEFISISSCVHYIE